jgi:hypothetical protein
MRVVLSALIGESVVRAIVGVNACTGTVLVTGNAAVAEI